MFEASLSFMVSSKTPWAKSKTLLKPQTKRKMGEKKRKEKLEAKVGLRVTGDPPVICLGAMNHPHLTSFLNCGLQYHGSSVTEQMSDGVQLFLERLSTSSLQTSCPSPRTIRPAVSSLPRGYP